MPLSAAEIRRRKGQGTAFVPVMIPAQVYDLALELTAHRRAKGEDVSVSHVLGGWILCSTPVVKGMAMLAAGAMPKDTPDALQKETNEAIVQNLVCFGYSREQAEAALIASLDGTDAILIEALTPED